MNLEILPGAARCKKMSAKHSVIPGHGRKNQEDIHGKLDTESTQICTKYYSIAFVMIVTLLKTDKTRGFVYC